MTASANLTGVRFGMLIVKERAYINEHRQSVWTCVCDCGREVSRSIVALRPNVAFSCGCTKRRPALDKRMALADEANTGRNDGSRLVPLTRGHFAIVDEPDFGAIMANVWHAAEGTSGIWYAERSQSLGRRRYVCLSMHREVIAAPIGLVVDHVNGNGLDNRRSNLRLASVAQNAANKFNSPNQRAGRAKGVTWNRSAGRWQAAIGHAGKVHYIGLFGSEEEASSAYDAEASRRFGEFANLNSRRSPL